jgi:acyl dehydratase
MIERQDLAMTQSRELLYLDDLTIGQAFVSSPTTVSVERLKSFAQEFDPQPFHLDEEAAKDSVFQGLAASGWHTAAMTMRMTVECLPIAGGLIGASGEIAWPRPTRPGDVLTAHCEVTDLRVSRTKPDRGIVTLRNETRNQHGEPVQVFVSNMMVPRRPA